MPFFNISDFIWDDFIYPRNAPKWKVLPAVSCQREKKIFIVDNFSLLGQKNELLKYNHH